MIYTAIFRRTPNVEIYLATIGAVGLNCRSSYVPSPLMRLQRPRALDRCIAAAKIVTDGG